MLRMNRRKRQLVLWSILTALVALVVLAAVSSPYISKGVLKSIQGIPGIEAEGARVNPLGVRVNGLSFNNPKSGVSGRVQEVHAGWLTVAGLGHTVKLKGGGIILPPFTVLLTRGGSGMPDLTLKFKSIEAVMPLLGRHLVLGGMTGRAVIRDSSLAIIDVTVDRIGGVDGGVRFRYDREASNSVSLRVNLSGLRSLMGPELQKAEGIVEFSGNLNPETLESTGSLRTTGVAVETSYIRLSGLRMTAEASFRRFAAQMDVHVTNGILRSTGIIHDFGLRPARLTVRGEEQDGVITVEKFELHAPGWVNMNLSGTVDASGRINIMATLTDVPLKPLLESAAVKVTSSGRASRHYQITGSWPRLSCRTVSEVDGVVLSIPSADLEILDIQAGPLEGEWQMEKVDKWQEK